MRLRAIGGLLAVVTGALVLASCGGEPRAHSAGATSATAPAGDPAAIVADLWKRRQAGMLTEDANVFSKVDTGTLATHDLAIAHLVACHCDTPRQQSPLVRVVVLQPHAAAPGPIFAEVFAGPAGHPPTRFIVVARAVGGAWRFALVTYDTNDEEGSRRLIDPAHPAPATTAADRDTGAAMLRREATEWDRWGRTGRPMSPIFTGAALRSYLEPGEPGRNRGTTNYGASTIDRVQTHPKDAVFTFRLDGKQVVTCGAIHFPTTYFAPAGEVLMQPENHRAWGPELAPGTYSDVTLDRQTMTCLLDHGPAAQPRWEGFGDYFADAVTATGRTAT